MSVCGTYSAKLVDGKAGGVLAVVGPKVPSGCCILVAGGSCKINMKIKVGLKDLIQIC